MINILQDILMLTPLSTRTKKARSQDIVSSFGHPIASWISEDVCKKGMRNIAGMTLILIYKLLMFLLMRVTDTITIFQVLKAYRNDIVIGFNGAFLDMDIVCTYLGDRENLSMSSYRTLATLVMGWQTDKIEILVSILESCHTNIDVDFEITYHQIDS